MGQEFVPRFRVETEWGSIASCDALNLEFSVLLQTLQEEIDPVHGARPFARTVLELLENTYRNSIECLAKTLETAGCYVPLGAVSALATVENQLCSIEQYFVVLNLGKCASRQNGNDKLSAKLRYAGNEIFNSVQVPSIPS